MSFGAVDTSEAQAMFPGRCWPPRIERLSGRLVPDIACSVELGGRYRFDKLAMRLKLSRQIPRRASGPPASQVIKCGPADLALHNLLAIPHRELERHQVGIISNGPS